MRGEKLCMIVADLAVDQSVFPSSTDVQAVFEDGDNTTAVDPEFVGDAPAVT